MTIQAEQLWPIAAKAVHGYVNKQFTKYFTKEEVEDMVGEVVFKTWRARNTFDEEKGTLNTWVWTIAKNTVRTTAMAKRNRSGMVERIEDEVIPLDTMFENSGYVEEDTDSKLLQREMVDGFFAKLRDERDKRFLNWQIEGLTAEEMAKREGTTKQNVYLILCRMRQRLRAQHLHEAA